MYGLFVVEFADCGGRGLAFDELKLLWPCTDGYDAAYDCRGAAEIGLGIVSRKCPFGLCRGFAKSSVNCAFASVEVLPR
jgi:hypothetical protein